MNKWWQDSLILDPFKLDAFDSRDWWTLPDQACAWLMHVCYLNAQHKQKGVITLVFELFLCLFSLNARTLLG
jgi:hypothetical protein